MPDLKLPDLTGMKLPDVNLPAVDLPDINLPKIKDMAKDLPGRRRKTVASSLVPLLVVGAITAIVGAILALALDPTMGRRRRAQARDQLAGAARRLGRGAARRGRWAASRATGMLNAAQHAGDAPEPADEVTLVNRVRTELFRDADIDKGALNINAEGRMVYLRGSARSPEQIAEIVERVSKVEGVDDVINLLHTSTEPAADSPEPQPVA